MRKFFWIFLFLLTPSSLFGQDSDNFTTMFGLLQRSEVRESLELTNEQLKQIEQAADKFSQATRQFAIDLQTQTNNEAGEKFKETVNGLNGTIGDILLPHQELHLQHIINHFRYTLVDKSSFGILSKHISTHIGLTDSQRSEIAGKASELEKEYKKKKEKFEAELIELRQRQRQTLLAMLDMEQRAKLEEILGDVDLSQLVR